VSHLGIKVMVTNFQSKEEEFPSISKAGVVLTSHNTTHMPYLLTSDSGSSFLLIVIVKLREVCIEGEECGWLR